MLFLYPYPLTHPATLYKNYLKFFGAVRVKLYYSAQESYIAFSAKCLQNFKLSTWASGQFIPTGPMPF